jgi:two-component system chemotaxis response regulator CheB
MPCSGPSRRRPEPTPRGVILTGMGVDGAAGLLEMRRAGARTLAQDEESCVVYGMAEAAVWLGSVEETLPLDALPRAIVAAVEQLLTRVEPELPASA